MSEIFKQNIPCERCGENPATSLFQGEKVCKDCYWIRSQEQKSKKSEDKKKKKDIIKEKLEIKE